MAEFTIPANALATLLADVAPAISRDKAMHRPLQLATLHSDGDQLYATATNRYIANHARQPIVHVHERLDLGTSYLDLDQVAVLTKFLTTGGKRRTTTVHRSGGLLSISDESAALSFDQPIDIQPMDFAKALGDGTVTPHGGEPSTFNGTFLAMLATMAKRHNAHVQFQFAAPNQVAHVLIGEDAMVYLMPVRDGGRQSFVPSWPLGK